MNQYLELKEKRQKEVNEFPLFFAFSNKQFDDNKAKFCEKFGFGSLADGELCSLGGGGYMRKADQRSYVQLFVDHEKQMIEAMGNDDFMIEAIEYELGNHEYVITYDPSDALNVLGLSLDDDRTVKNFKIARDRYMAWQYEHGELSS